MAAGLPGHLHGAPDWRGLGGGRPFQPVQFFQQPHHHFAPHMLNTMERHLSPRISTGKLPADGPFRIHKNYLLI